ncbi:MAG: hypothetical protein AB7E80_09855 [Hyphomicrobiaceae bacterium]
MSPEMTGALAGAAFGLVNFAILRMVASRAENDKSNPKAKQAGGILRMVALADLIVFPVLGYFLGPIVLAP